MKIGLTMLILRVLLYLEGIYIMKILCPECYAKMKDKSPHLIKCFLRPIYILTQFPEAGYCPICNKIWNEDGREIILTGHINVELEKIYNPSRREDD
jgi:hypothetical protein